MSYEKDVAFLVVPVIVAAWPIVVTAIYYNENDPQAAAWLTALMLEGVIPAGDIDDRSIEDVTPADLAGYVQCHFFAGIGGWPEALRIAGWPVDRPVWTGSCPCQPFSNAGNRGGTDDPRHLWPVWRWLIDQCRPSTVFGEQVASKAGRAWLAGVRADLEAMGYGVGAADLCAAGVGAPHIRQRLWWVADANANGQYAASQPGDDDRERDAESRRRLGNAKRAGLEGHARHVADGHKPGRQHANAPGPIAEARRNRWQGIYIPCADGKARRIKPGIEPLVNGLPGRVGLLRGYGNAIVTELAATFIEAAHEARKV